MNYLEKVKLKLQKTTVLNNESGMGVVEYILLLFVIVTILGGSIYQFNKSFESWVKNYFGLYLQCLLETGELPSIGSEEEGICNDEYQAFSFSAGRPPLSNNPNGGGRNNSGGSDSNKPSTKVGTNNSKSGSSSTGARSTSRNVPRSNLGGGSGSNLRRSRIPLSPSNSRQSSRSETSDSSSSGGGYESFQDNKFGSTSQSVNEYGRPEVVEYNFSDREKEEAKGGGRTASIEANDADKANAQKVPFSQRKRERKLASDDGIGFSMGNLIRFAFIIGIILAIIFFLFSQLQKVRKQMDGD